MEWTTFEDHGVDRDDVIAIFELLDAQPELEPKDVSPVAVMRGEAVPRGYEDLIDDGLVTEAELQETGSGEFSYTHEAGGFSLGGVYGPAGGTDGDRIIDGWLPYDDRELQGNVIEDAYLDIIEATSAPYLNQNSSGQDLERAVADGHLGDFDVPTDYDRDALEQSVEAAIARLNAAAAVQNAVAETAAQYAADLAEDGVDYQQ